MSREGALAAVEGFCGVEETSSFWLPRSFPKKSGFSGILGLGSCVHNQIAGL